MTTIKITSRLLDHVGSALCGMLPFEQPADAVLSRVFRDHRELGHRERGFVADTAYGVLRRKRYLEKFCGADRATPRRLLLVALVRLAHLNQRQLAEALTAKELDWVAELKALPEPELSLAEAADFPDWLADQLLAEGRSAEEVLQLARSLNQSAPLDLRVNPMKITREAVLERFQAEGIEARACPYAPLGLRLAQRPALAKHPLFLDGSIEVQDEGSQLLGHLVAPKRGEMVVDFCAGAGGKTLLLGALMRSTGRLYAFDVSDRRLTKLKPRLARSGLSNVHTAAIASEQDQRIKRLAGKIDRVLVDAPCSGLGTLRRNPDLKWRQTPESLAELTVKQAAILAAASRLVKVGGRLVYATCSLLEAENEAIVSGFLATHPDFVRKSCGEILASQGIALEMGESLRLLPHQHGTDGFYAAVLERQA